MATKGDPMKFVPIGKNIIVEISDKPTDKNALKVMSGHVVSGGTSNIFDILEGDEVFFKSAHHQFLDEGKTVVAVSIDDVVARGARASVALEASVTPTGEATPTQPGPPGPVTPVAHFNAKSLSQD
jgi:co-chaperonin GroES (HSP10)